MKYLYLSLLLFTAGAIIAFNKGDTAQQALLYKKKRPQNSFKKFLSALASFEDSQKNIRKEWVRSQWNRADHLRHHSVK